MLSANSGFRAGTFGQNIRTAPFTTSPEEFMYTVRTAGANLLVSLHPANQSPGLILSIKKTTGIDNQFGSLVQIRPFAGDLIDGSSDDLIIEPEMTSILIRSDGVSWWRMDTTLQGPSPVWYQQPIVFANLFNASLTATANLRTLPARTVIHGAIIKTGTAFSGPGITDVKVALGFAGNNTKIMPYVDVDTAASPANFVVSNILNLESFSAGIQLQLYGVATGANFDQLTAGTLNIYLLMSQFNAPAF